VSGSDSKRTDAYKITGSTVYLQVFARVVRDATTVLEISRVAEEHDTLDLIANGSRELGNGTCDHGGTLTVEVLDMSLSWEGVMNKHVPVAASNDGSVRTFLIRLFKQAHSFINRSLGSAAGQCVRA